MDETGESAEHERWCPRFWSDEDECICARCGKRPCACIRGDWTVTSARTGKPVTMCSNEISGEIDSVGVVHWLDPWDCDPPHGLDMAGSHDRLKVCALADAFEDGGFDPSFPALVGYVKDGRVQLLSGTHRHAAAKMVGCRLPVVLWLGSDIEKSWGDLERWRRVIEDIPVGILRNWTREDLAGTMEAP